MMNEILDLVIGNVFEIIMGAISIIVSVYLIPLIQTELKPWLKEKRIYSMIKKFVNAAEKLAETGVIEKVNKKDKVIELLEQNGIKVDTKLEAFIEAAVKELDLITSTIVNTMNGTEEVQKQIK